MEQLILPRELDELKPLKQWVCYQLVWNEKKGKYGKVPKDPATGYGAKANDPGTWATYADAVKTMQSRQFDGIGFEFAAGYMGIDLDDVVSESGEINQLAADIVRELDSYTEYSPSGRGLHILVKTDLGPVGKRNDDIGLEMYNTGRFFTVTGNAYGQAKPIQERTKQVKVVIAKYLPDKDKSKQPDVLQQVAKYRIDESEAEIWGKMFSSKKGEEIRSLYDGNLSGYGDDHSRADQALANHLAYWTNGDAQRMDAMFRQSGLMREKWDQRRGDQTYGEITIAEALRDFRPYIPPIQTAAQPKAQGGEPSNNMDNSAQQGIHEKNSMQDNTSPFIGSSQPDGLRNYIYRAMGADLDHFQSFKDRKTGYRNLDAITSLYPGLYVIGAISSLGKTTFIHQMGDQLAAAGDHVLYFSLEQSRLEMVTKGISRITAQHSYMEGFKTAVSAIDIRRGTSTEAVKAAAKEYGEKAKTESIIECGFDTTIYTIVNYVNSYMEANKGVKPVVIVDYLQIIRPADPRQTTRDAVDAHVRALKMLQRNNDLVVLVICSLNRQNYLTPVDFESFKESGGIEYTADVVWGLQLSIMTSELFDSDKKIKEKREAVRLAKLQVPRKIQLICLKNRYGRSSYECGFNYFPKYDLFLPEDEFIPDDEGFLIGYEVPEEDPPEEWKNTQMHF